MKFQNRTFRNEVVELDGNEFDVCDIQYCTLIYLLSASCLAGFCSSESV
jgi:hypothetical protein